jgi:hypothetical protein
LAFESLDSFVDLQVLVQISFLSEALVTVLEWAVVGSGVGVNHQVVEEIMPFPEGLPAPWKIAEHYSNELPRTQSLGLEDDEVVEWWNHFVDSYLAEAEIFAAFYGDQIVIPH